MKNKFLTLLTLLSFALSGFGETVSISTPTDLVAFASRVNAGEFTLDAVLTADIDLQGVEVSVIGNSPANAFKGIFDGQGHKISNYSLTINSGFTAGYGYGMFGNAKGATIKNFTIDGTMTFDNKEGKTSDLGCALIGWPETGTLVQNIKSTMTIDAKISTHVGGIVGSLCDATIDRCEFAGTLNGYSSSNGVGGITGYTNLGTITNCIFSGTITGTGTGYFAGVLGYVNNGNAVMKNCLSYGILKNTTSPKKGTLVSYLRNIGKYSNNFYIGGEKGIGGGEQATTDLASANTILVTDEQLASGEVTCKLGEAFRQKLGTDAYPKIGTGSDIVILNGTYQNVTSTLALEEDMDFDTGTDFDIESVTLACTLKGGNWETFCVPFDMTSEEIASQLGAGAEVKELTGVSEEFDNYALTFSTAPSIVAGKPYMVKVQNDVTSISLGNKTIKGGINNTTADEITFVGTCCNGYVPTGGFVINNNKTARVTGIVNIKAFRGYITATDGVVVKMLTLGLDGIEDGIEPSTQVSDRPTFAVLGNSISTYYDYIPSGYAIYYTTDREKNNDLQVGDQWWMQLSRMSGLSFLANAAWSGSRVAFDSSTLNGIGPFCSDARVKALGRAGNPDFIFVLGGTNDWAHSSNIPLGEYCTEEFKDSLSFRGAYSLLLHKLTTRYPKARVVCLSILPRGEAATQVNAAGWTQADGNASIKHIAEQFGQYFIDCSTIPFSSNWSKYMISGNLHPTAAGFTLMAEHITEALISQGIISDDLKRKNETESAERLLDISFTQDGIVNKGTYDATVGKQGTATTTYDADNNIYLGTTKALGSDYFYVTYDEGTPLAEAFNNSVTWEMLVRLDTLEDQNGNATKTCIMGNEQDGGWCFYNSDYASTFSYTHKSGVKSSVKNFNGTRILIPGKFYHLVVTMDRTSHVIRYFVNGQLVRTGTRAATDMPLPKCGSVKGHQGMWICLGGDATSGTCTSGAENSSACSFVFARIYNGALTEKAALNLYDEEVRKFTESAITKISNAADLRAFANQVNGGDVAANAILTNDIDMTGETWPAPIGLWGSNRIAYKGQFNGQGHSIKNLTYTTAQNYHGLFGVISTGALIENFNISGTITNTQYSPFGAVVGFARDDNPTIRNIHSSVNINNSKAGARIGGILGHSNEASTVNVDRCTYSGTLDGKDAGGSGNYGGIVGYTQNSTSTLCNITCCLFDGELKNSATSPGDCTFGGLVGYIGANPKVTAKNCLSIGKVQSKITGQFYGAVKNATCSIINSYYQGTYVNGEASGSVTPGIQEATAVTAEQLASGEICYKLNGDQTEINWYQTLPGSDATVEADPYPVLYGSHLQVWNYDGLYSNDGPDGIGGPTPFPSLYGWEVYDLSGRIINFQLSTFNSQLKLRKGLYIVNGKKAVIK
jgi:lysophospholipase L1-like esterase